MEMRGKGELKAPHLPESYDFRKGRLYPKNKPGLGIEFDPKQAQQVLEVTERHRPIPLHHRPDGSVTNW
jgi:L-alanine-DL-glutamate epimerase-like enolase superfamily enzyme